MTDTRVLNIRETLHLGTILGWCSRNARLRWVDDSGDIREGTARCIGDQNGNFLNSTDDVRDAFVRITTANGFEWFPSMSEVVEKLDKGFMGADN